MRKELYSVESKEVSSPAGSSPSAAGDRLQVTEDSKLHGTNVFPFSFKLPRGVAIPFGAANGAVSKYLLPASLHEAASDTSIVYQIVVRVKKGMLSSDSRCVFVNLMCVKFIQFADLQTGDAVRIFASHSPRGSFSVTANCLL